MISSLPTKSVVVNYSNCVVLFVAFEPATVVFPQPQRLLRIVVGPYLALELGAAAPLENGCRYKA
eukprot:COSAG05_NODE_5293_length_1213_cov_0.912029_2_plen_65_part_00